MNESKDEAEQRRPDASMSLLREIMDRPRDGVYEDARSRSAGDNGKRSWVQETIVLILAIAIGTGGVWAARQLRTPVESALSARSVLEEQITDRSQLTDSLRLEIEDLRAEIADLEDRESTPADKRRAEEAELDSMSAGTTAVIGPGVEVVLTEASSPSTPEEHVLDVDVQIVVNGLWASGAEAVSINGRRLSFGTAIRAAGESILVDLEPIQGPYTVTAIGDPDLLLRSFSQTTAAEHLKALSSTYRITATLTQLQRIEMKAGNSLRLNYVEPMSAWAVHDTLDPKGD